MQGFGFRVFTTYGSLGCRVSEIGLLKRMGVCGAGFRI